MPNAAKRMVPLSSTLKRASMPPKHKGNKNNTNKMMITVATIRASVPPKRASSARIAPNAVCVCATMPEFDA